jgi:ABC-type branched-subunit amino acid transport system substrate-binding protein
MDGAGGKVGVAATLVETMSRLETVSRERGFNHVEMMWANDGGKIIPPGTQAIVLDTNAVTAGDTILALRENGVNLPLLGQVEVGSPQLTQVAGPAAAGLIFVSPGPAPADVGGTAAFREAYQTMAGFAPGPRAVLAYDAANILLDAIAQAGPTPRHSPTRAEVSAVINSIERGGLSGEIRFDAQGQRVNAPVWIYRVSEEGWYPGALLVPEE